tara:strand:- start:48884 stop:49588 length:705 start_codon:yes stop_codon:yes gene_type:complete
MKFFFFFSVFFLLSACNFETVKGSDIITQKSFDITDFTEIDVSSAIEVELLQSDDYKVTLECNDNVVEVIDISKKEEILRVKVKGSYAFTNVKIKVTIHAPAINRIESSGASSITIEDYEAKNFELDFSGASEINAKLIVSEQLKVEASGASSIKLRGKAKNVSLDFSGASDFDSKKLIVSDKLTAESSGASSIKVTANGTLELDVSGASEVTYYGNGTISKSDISGAGSVEQK